MYHFATESYGSKVTKSPSTEVAEKNQIKDYRETECGLVLVRQAADDLQPDPGELVAPEGGGSVRRAAVDHPGSREKKWIDAATGQRDKECQD